MNACISFSFHLTSTVSKLLLLSSLASISEAPHLAEIWGWAWKPVVWFKFHLTPTANLQQKLLGSKQLPALISRRLTTSPSGSVPSMALSAAEEAYYWVGELEPPAEWPCALDFCQGSLMLAQQGHFLDAMATNWHWDRGGEGQHGLPMQPLRLQISARRSPKPTMEIETRLGHMFSQFKVTHVHKHSPHHDAMLSSPSLNPSSCLTPLQERNRTEEQTLFPCLVKRQCRALVGFWGPLLWIRKVYPCHYYCSNISGETELSS